MNYGSVKKVVKNPYKVFSVISNWPIFRCLPDTIFLKLKFRGTLGYPLNLKSPKTFNEKLQWLKLYDRNPLYTMLVDKYKVKRYVASIIGDEYIIPTLGVWDSFDEIDFDKLPDQFVLKCTHDSGGLIICKDKRKLNLAKVRRIINKSLNANYYYNGREWPYKNVKPRIIAEKYMQDEHEKDLKDYKIMCFNGKVRMSFVCSERSDKLKVTFFDNNWRKLPFQRHYPTSDTDIPKPQNFSKMVELAEVLSKNIPFVRVDFYEINGKLYFGEMTFFPGGGFEEFTPSKWDKKIGDLITLSCNQ